MIEDLLPVTQPQNVTAARLLFLTLAPPPVGYNKRQHRSRFERLDVVGDRCFDSGLLGGTIGGRKMP